MYYIERNAISDAMFLAGSIAEPHTGETEWVSGSAYAVGVERIRSSLHRVFKCAAAVASGTTTPPENDPTRWKDMRPTSRYLPFGPTVKANGKLVYQSLALKSTADIEYRLAQRYANAVAIFGAQGGNWRVRVYDSPGGTLVDERSGRIKSAASGYWDYAYGQRSTNDRVLITGLPMFSNAEVRITIEGSGSQLRAVSQIEVGKLRYIPGVEIGGVEYGLSRAPRVFTARQAEEDGSTSVLIYGSSFDMSGAISIKGTQEDAALVQLRRLLGRGVAYAPTLLPGYQQSLLFGVLKTSDVTRNSSDESAARFYIEGLPIPNSV